MQNSLKRKALVVGIILMLIGASAVFYHLITADEVKKEVELVKPTVSRTQLLTKTYAQMKQEGLLEKIDIVDDRISPYENQGVIVEILRIRHRGLLEKLSRPGMSWRTTPEFYFITDINGMVYESNIVEQHRQVSEILFNTWDTLFQENKVVRTAKQEQETSTVTITIVEREKIGLLGLRTRDVEKDSLTVTFCYRTGRWTGDDYFGDPDGYGYYLGDTFEIWFNMYKPDYDNDYIPFWMEVNILGTDPTVDDSNLDPDDDGIPTYWEWRWGYDPFTWDDHINLDPDMDSLTNIWEYRLEKYFANPFIENIYVEVDFMERTRRFQKIFNQPPTVFYEESKQGLIERFAQHNIKAFFDDGWPNTPPNGGGQIVPYIDRLSQDSGMILQYYNNYFPDERKGGFIYLLLGYRVGGGFQHPARGNVYDTIYIWDIPFDVFAPLKHMEAWIGYGRFPTPRGVRIGQGGLILHELGHFGGLVQDLFAGVDIIDYNLIGGSAFERLQGKEFRQTWGQYRSVMNYAYTQRQIDYSNGENGPPYDQNDWANFHLGGWGGVSPVLEEAYYLSYGEEWEAKIQHLVEKDTDEIETPPITGYVYDQNLTEAFGKKVGDWSPNTRWNVEWAVHRLVEEERFPHYRDIKVFAQPRDIESKYQWIWSLYMEGDFDAEGNILFAHSIPFNTLTLDK